MAAGSSSPTLDPANYARRLAIIVPDRNRAEHLARFLPHMVTYFQRDKLDRAIAYSIHAVEQLGEGPFNRGAPCNAGAQATAKIFTAKLLAGASAFSREGYASLEFRYEETAVSTRNGAPQQHIRHHKVALPQTAGRSA
jgi:hypothetical protein